MMCKTPLLIAAVLVTVANADVERKSHEDYLRHLKKVVPAGAEGLFNPLNIYDSLPIEGVDPAFECAWREAAFAYGKKLQPKRDLTTLGEALQLTTCNSSAFAAYKRPVTKKVYEVGDRPMFVVAAVGGSDSNPGTVDSPFATVFRAVEASRGVGGAAVIALRQGTHYLEDTIHLSTADNGLTIQNYNGEDAAISGAQLIETPWLPYNVSKGSGKWIQQSGQNNVYGGQPGQYPYDVNGTFGSAAECQAACQGYPKCHSYTWHDNTTGSYAQQCWFRLDDVWSPVAEPGHVSGYKVDDSKNIYVGDLSQIPGGAPKEITGLRLNGARMIRARYPNANPELDSFPKGWISGKTTWFGPLHGEHPSVNIEVSQPNRSFEQDEFENFVLGVGGTCDSFTPPEGYWCSDSTSGGGAFTYRIPAGLVYSPELLPNSPSYKNPVGAVIQAWRPAHWASWMFEVDGVHEQNSSFTWTKGGFQGARGSNSGAEWFIENVFEELDSPSEFFYDTTEQKLYFYYNNTPGIGPPTDTFEATKLKVLIDAVGAQENPIKNITIQGITIKDAALTYLDPHGMPSGGDWGLQRTAAVFLEGTESFKIEGCLFTRNDGIAVMFSGYNRYGMLDNNEVVWNGETAFASWGYTARIDGTDGNQPRHCSITNNYIHELGHYEKQSSPYFQAKTAQSRVTGNIFFNGPRALINLNDGFGGDSLLDSNLLFNSCRESSDHGPINSWDRQPFITKVGNGTASLVPAYTHISNNFAVANYGANGGCFDTDDGSSWYKIENNFFVFGGHKSDFNGHNKRSTGNINVYPSVYGPKCVGVPLPDPAHGHDFDEGYSNCTCVLANAGGLYLSLQNCDATKGTDAITLILGGNKVYAPDANAIIKCDNTQYNLTQWQTLGLDSGTTLHDATTEATAADIIQWAKALLGF